MTAGLQKNITIPQHIIGLCEFNCVERQVLDERHRPQTIVIKILPEKSLIQTHIEYTHTFTLFNSYTEHVDRQTQTD